MKTINKKSSAMKQVETKTGGRIEETLRVMYVDKHMHVADIAEELNISYLTCNKWLKLAGIYSRKLKVGS